ncbi:MAG TPA: hypothetical protein VFP86_15585 [bacterium]|nr:hypothetical protein [bacterium]
MPKSPRAHSGRFPRSRQEGLALVEVLVTVLLMAMVVGALLPLLTSGQQGSDYARRRQVMIRNGRVALDRLIREMRAAESFRTLAPGQIGFTLSWGDGTGAEPSVQYSLNTVTHNIEYRWSANYDYRRRITIQAQTALPAGYAVAVTLNHAALVAAGKSLAGGDDIRVRYWNGSAMVELDRVLDPISAWNAAATTIWFPLQTAIGGFGSDPNYYLDYGNLADANPPAYGSNVFLDYQDGTALDGWARRDSLPGTDTTSATDGFVFQASLGAGRRELTKTLPHSDVEVFWGFWGNATDNGNGNQSGVSARLSDSGAGYRLLPADNNNSAFGLYYGSGWGTTGTLLASVPGSVIPGASYYARFYLVGSSLQAKYWPAGTPEPPTWQLAVTDAQASSGNQYGQVDGSAPTMDHRHRTMIVRPRVALEPVTSLGSESSGSRSDPLSALAGPFSSLNVTCFDATNASIPCSPTAPVRAVQVALVVIDPDGVVPDITLTDEAFRRSP